MASMGTRGDEKEIDSKGLQLLYKEAVNKSRDPRRTLLLCSLLSATSLPALLLAVGSLVD